MASRRPPIAFFAYNRPAHARRALESLAENAGAAESELFLFSDGPRRPEAAPAVLEVRKILLSRPWCGKVNLVERHENFGCANSIVNAVTQLCGSHGRVIVVEDDLALAPDFLDYMHEALERYAEEEQVFQISAFNFPSDPPPSRELFFLPAATSWGWGTWKRAWDHFDRDGARAVAFLEDEDFRLRFTLGGACPLDRMLRGAAEGRLDAWDIFFWLAICRHGGLTLFPARPLAAQCGLDGSGMNCARDEAAGKELGRDLAFLPFARPFAWPERVEADTEAFERFRAANQRFHERAAASNIGWLGRLARFWRGGK